MAGQAGHGGPIGGKLRLEHFFSGHIEAWGVVEDLRGQFRREFSIAVEGTWDGETLVLDERFDYADGERERRCWTIRKTGDGAYEGTAQGVIGVAHGEVQGNRFSWQYRFSLPLFGAPRTVTFRDRFYLRPNGLLLNIADISKFGVTIATVSTVFHNPDAVADARYQGLQAAE